MRSSIAIRRRRSGFWLRSIRAITKRAKSAPFSDGFGSANSAHDLAGKRIVPFFTSGGSGAGRTLDYLKPSAPKATFVPPKNLTHADESAIRTWVQGLQ